MNGKKMFYIGLNKKFMFLFDVLEQFNIERFDLDVSHNFYILSIVLIVGVFLGSDIWFSFSFFILITLIIFSKLNTVNFILILYVLFCIIVLFELTSPVLELGYFWLAVTTDFILAKTREHLGGKLQAYYIFLVGTAVILGFFNGVGLLPYTAALTGQFIFAFYFSIMYFVVNIICGVLYHHNKIFNLFLPKGVPVFIVPALIIIEAISFFSRVLSLAIRLFANIVAGHILLKILVSFLNVILKAHISFGLPSLLAFAGISIIIVLEVFIGILQVYIFNLLLLIYINGVLDLH